MAIYKYYTGSAWVAINNHITDELTIVDNTNHSFLLKPKVIDVQEDTDELQVKSKRNTYTLLTVVAPDTTPKEATMCVKVENSGTNHDESYFMDLSAMNYGNVDEEPECSIYVQSRNATTKPKFNIGWTDENQTRHKKFIINPDALPIMLTSTGIWVKNTNSNTTHGWADRTELSLAEIQKIKDIGSKLDARSDNSNPYLYAYGKFDGSTISFLNVATSDAQFNNANNYGYLPNVGALKSSVVRLEPDGANQNYDNTIYQIYGHTPLSVADNHKYAMQYCFNVSNTPSQATIPQYNSNANLKSSTPVDNNDVATKQYVDNHSPSITPEPLGTAQNSGYGNLQFTFWNADLTNKQGLGVFTYGNCNILINLYGLQPNTTYYQNCIYRKSGATATSGLRNGMLSYSYVVSGSSKSLQINLYTINSDGTIGSIDTSATQYTAYLFLVNLK